MTYALRSAAELVEHHGPPTVEGTGLRVGELLVQPGRVTAVGRRGALRSSEGRMALWPWGRTPRYVLVSGLPRAGTSWLARLTATLLRLAGAAWTVAQDPRDDDFPSNDPGDAEDLRLRAHVASHTGGWHLAKTHYASDLPVATLWVGRDLRDLMASTCHYALAGPAGPHFAGTPPDEVYRQVVDATLPRTLAALEALRSAPRTTLPLRYEDLLADTAIQVHRIAAHLDVALPSHFAEAIARTHTFHRESGREPGDEDRSSYHRAGVVGGWEAALPDVVRDTVLEAHARLGDLYPAR